MKKNLELFIDGACSGNPGEAAVGVVVFEGQRIVRRISQSIGEATNNIAEYTALIFALQEALFLRAKDIRVNTDSELLYYQLKGEYKVKSTNLKLLFYLVNHLLEGFDSVHVRRIPREKNKEADALATRAIKKGQAKTVAPLFDSREESPSSAG